jgi:hypothetical protein
MGRMWIRKGMCVCVCGGGGGKTSDEDNPCVCGETKKEAPLRSHTP